MGLNYIFAPKKKKMKNKVISLSWQKDIASKLECESIDNDIILFDNFDNTYIYNTPLKLDMMFICVCTKGTIRGSVDFQLCDLSAPFAIIIRPNQILHYEQISNDFTGYCLALSNRFSYEILPIIDKQLSIAAAIRQTSYTQLDTESLPFIRRYFWTIKKIIAMTDNPYRLEMIKHLTMMFFYMAHPYFQKHIETSVQTRQSLLVEQFTNLVREHYRRERKTSFYAAKLSLTPKYLSQVIKSATDKSASDWIDDFVILEAKALLKSTNMTIQQICYELNFPSQSFFGKYFKRIVGVSPSEYMRK